jgi:hypothetical protein
MITWPAVITIAYLIVKMSASRMSGSVNNRAKFSVPENWNPSSGLPLTKV